MSILWKTGTRGQRISPKTVREINSTHRIHLSEQTWVHLSERHRAGSGKTNLICNLAKEYVQKQPTVVVLGNLFLNNEFGIEEYIKRSLEYYPDVQFKSFQQCFTDINKIVSQGKQEFLIFIDAINENLNIDLMKNTIRHILSQHKDKRIKFCITCRDIYWNFFKGDFWDLYVFKIVKNQLYNFTKNEFDLAIKRYFEHFNIRGELEADAVEKCKHPLLLRFFCEAYKDIDIEVFKDIRLEELFDRYWKRKTNSIAEKIPDCLYGGEIIEEYLFSIVKYMMKYNVRSILSKELGNITGEKNIYHKDSIYTRILDEDIIIVEKLVKEGKPETQVVFVYDEFMEYLMAREIMSRLAGKNEHEVICEIENLAEEAEGFASIFGIMVYLSLILKRERQISIWDQLINKGVEWNEMLCESIRKMTKDLIDKEVFVILHELTKSENISIRMEVANILKLKRIRGVAPLKTKAVLETLLADPILEVKIRAISALKKMGEQALDTLTQCLEYKSVKVRIKTINALQVIKKKEVIKILIDTMIKDKSYRVQQEAKGALKRIGTAELVDPIVRVMQNGKPSDRINAVDILGNINSEKAISHLIISLNDENYPVREKAISGLRNTKKNEVIEPLYKALKDDRKEISENAFLALVEFNSKEAVKALLKALNDEEIVVRHKIASFLGEKKIIEAVVPLINALKDKDWWVCMLAARALGEIKSKKAVIPLIGLLEHEDSSVRREAVRALGRIRSKKSVKPLAKALKDQNWKVSVEAVRVLKEIGNNEVLEEIKRTKLSVYLT